MIDYRRRSPRQRRPLPIPTILAAKCPRPRPLGPLDAVSLYRYGAGSTETELTEQELTAVRISPANFARYGGRAYLDTETQ